MHKHEQHIALEHESRSLLKILGLASLATATVATFEYRAIPGYPIGWLLHPGLSSGVCAVTVNSLRVLCDGGYMECDGDLTEGASVRCFLTSQGEAACSLLLMNGIVHEADMPDVRH